MVQWLQLTKNSLANSLSGQFCLHLIRAFKNSVVSLSYLHRVCQASLNWEPHSPAVCHELYQLVTSQMYAVRAVCVVCHQVWTLHTACTAPKNYMCSSCLFNCIYPACMLWWWLENNFCVHTCTHTCNRLTLYLQISIITWSTEVTK